MMVCVYWLDGSEAMTSLASKSHVASKFRHTSRMLKSIVTLTKRRSVIATLAISGHSVRADDVTEMQWPKDPLIGARLQCWNNTRASVVLQDDMA